MTVTELSFFPGKAGVVSVSPVPATLDNCDLGLRYSAEGLLDALNTTISRPPGFVKDNPPTHQISTGILRPHRPFASCVAEFAQNPTSGLRPHPWRLRPHRPEKPVFFRIGDDVDAKFAYPRQDEGGVAGE